MSTLQPAGRDAQETAVLFWVMVAGATVIWVAVTLLALYAAKTKRPQWSVNTGYRLIIGGGVVLPTVVLAALLAYGLPGIGRLSPAPVSEALAIEVSGEWWWRVRYGGPAGPPVELANEIRLPVGHRTDVTLTSDNVIHAFWIPSLAGKVDMIPRRTTRISLEPTRTGSFRGEVMRPIAARLTDEQRRDVAAYFSSR